MLRFQADGRRAIGAPVGAHRVAAPIRLVTAAATAISVAALEVTAAHAIGPQAPHPDFVLILVAVIAVAADLDIALVTTVIGGLALDALAFRPLGLSALELLVVLAATSTAVSRTTGVRRAIGATVVFPAAIAIEGPALLSAHVAKDLGDLLTPLVWNALSDSVIALLVMLVGLTALKRVTKERLASQ